MLEDLRDLRKRIHYITQQLKRAKTPEEQRYWQKSLNEGRAELEKFKTSKYTRKSRNKQLFAIYSPKEIAEKTGFAQSTIYSWIYRGELRTIRRGASYRITEHDLNEFMGRYYG